MSVSEPKKKLVDKMLGGDRVALARLMTLVESRDDSVRDILKSVGPKTGDAYTIGITGPPGGGKSTLLNKLISLLRKKDMKLGIVAIDPTSPFSGGAILGDRIRMQEHAIDEHVFIRSLASRGSHGGLSGATNEVVKLYDAFGVDFVMIETVGVGQTELDIIKHADTVLVVLVPEAGDVVQTMKAGLMEIGNIFIINKADRNGAQKLSKELLQMLSMRNHEHESGWDVPVLLTRAERGEGVDEVMDSIEKHRDFQTETGLLKEKREKRREEEISQIIMEAARLKISERLKSGEIEKIRNLIKTGELDLYEGADQIISKIF